MEKKPIGHAIAELRQKKGMTAAELAEHMDVAERTVEEWECESTAPNAEQLAALAELFGVTAEELAEGRFSVHAYDDITRTKQVEREQDLFKLICRTVALAMGIAVTVLSFMDRMDPKDAVTMLGIGLTCLGISAFHRKK